MAQPMTKDISVKIRETSGLTLTKFAKKHDIDYGSLKSFISGNCNGEKKNSKAQKVKSKLLALEIITNSDIAKMREPAKIRNKAIQKDKADRRKVIARMRRKLKKSVSEYFEHHRDYFTENDIQENLFRSFISGIGTGIRKDTKTYFIRKILEKDELLDVLKLD